MTKRKIDQPPEEEEVSPGYDSDSEGFSEELVAKDAVPQPEIAPAPSRKSSAKMSKKSKRSSDLDAELDGNPASLAQLQSNVFRMQARVSQPLRWQCVLVALQLPDPLER